MLRIVIVGLGVFLLFQAFSMFDEDKAEAFGRACGERQAREHGLGAIFGAGEACRDQYWNAILLRGGAGFVLVVGGLVVGRKKGESRD